MIWEIEHVKAHHFVRVKCTGVFSIEKHPENLQKLFTSRFWKPGMNLLFDKRSFSFGQINLKILRTASNQYQTVIDRLGSGKVALLMQSTFNYGIGRQFQMLSDGKLPCEIHVFYDENKAVGWLTEKE